MDHIAAPSLLAEMVPRFSGGWAMSLQLSVGTVRDSPYRAIYAVRVQDAVLTELEAETVATRMRERLEARGEVSADVVVVWGQGKETLRLFGNPYSVGRVRT